MTIITQDRLRVAVSSMPGPWRTASGYSGEADVTKLRVEAGGVKVALSGPQEYGDVTTERVYDAERDTALVARLQREHKFPGTTITLSPLDEQYNAIPGTSVTISGCQVKSWELPEADADSADAAVLQIVWSVG